MAEQMTAQEVRALREAMGFTQEGLARALGIKGTYAKDTVRAWESGKAPIGGPASLALRLMAAILLDSELPEIEGEPEAGAMLQAFREVGRAVLEALWK